MNKDEYINRVLQRVSNKAEHFTIRQELLSHIEDNEKYYIDAGYDQDYAAQKAISRMGEPSEVGVHLNNLHSNKKAIILSVIFLILYILGLCWSDIDIVSYMIINMVDLEEITIGALLFSSLTFIAGALSFNYALKSKNKPTLLIFGIISLLGWVLGPFALIPAGYSFLALFTDLPAAMFFTDLYSNTVVGTEAFWSFDAIIPFENLSMVIDYTLIVLNALFGIFALITGIFAIITVKKLKNCENMPFDYKFEKRVNKYSKLLIIVAAISCIGAFSITVNDCLSTYYNDKAFKATESIDTVRALNVYDNLEFNLSFDEVIAAAEDNGEDVGVDLYDYYVVTDNETGYRDTENYIEVYHNDHYTITLIDNDDDEIYEQKRMWNNGRSSLTENKVLSLKDLPKTTTVTEFFNIVSMSSIDVRTSKKVGNDVFDTFEVDSKNDKESVTVRFKNSKLLYVFESVHLRDYEIPLEVDDEKSIITREQAEQIALKDLEEIYDIQFEDFGRVESYYAEDGYWHVCWSEEEIICDGGGISIIVDEKTQHVIDITVG